jgi:hypothetical protein
MRSSLTTLWKNCPSLILVSRAMALPLSGIYARIAFDELFLESLFGCLLVAVSPHCILFLFFLSSSDALTANKLLGLTTINLSNNPMEDKGMISFANYLSSMNRGLVKLSLSTCSGAKAVCRVFVEPLLS